MDLQRRLELQTLLEEFLGSEEVHFQQPPDSGMSYPSIIYKRDSQSNIPADNIPYMVNQRYQVTLISRDPDNPLVKPMSLLANCSFQRNYVADQLNHDVFLLYF